MTILFPRIPSGARATMQLIDTIRNADRPVTIPGINAYRGARRQEIEQTAFEIERQLAQFMAAVRALIVNLNENTPTATINIESYLTDVSNGGHDLVSEVRGMANRLDDLREMDR